jgi:DNA mismatch repair protein MutS2
MNSHALQVLEFHRVREFLAAYAASDLGREAIRSIEPAGDREAIERQLDETEEMRRLLDAARVPLLAYRDLAGVLRRLAAGGRPAEPELLFELLELLRNARALREVLRREPGAMPRLEAIGAAIEDQPALRERIESCIDAKDGVRDDASERLGRLRGELSSLRESIRARITRKLGDPRLQRALGTEGVKFKNDRYLLPVRAEHRSVVPGPIRDRSSTGATLYIEPEELVYDGDALIRVIDEERNEVRRILWELTREVLAAEDALRRLQDLLARVDVACAKARAARAFGWVRPKVASLEAGFDLELVDARHPHLLWLAAQDAEAAGAGGTAAAGARRGESAARPPDGVDLTAVHGRVAPLSVRLGGGVQLLVVTGPNTGGKTVALKTIGINVLMALSGIPIPAGAGSRVPCISNLYADIGDEQSIEQSLSTFSSHLRNIQTILAEGDAGSLVLLDELGAGTDPIEGAALATALLVWFLRRGWHGVITTHLGSLKEFAYLNDGAENASMQFDPVTLAPTYRMVVGLPGISHALEISRRFGLPAEILEDARARVDEAQGPTQEVIERMVHSHQKLEKERRRMERLRMRAQGERRAAETEREEARLEREAFRKEAEMLADDVIRSARDRLAPLVKKLAAVPGSLQPVVDELRVAIELLLAGTPLGERREAFARGLKKEDEVFVPKFRERCKVRKINKGERVVTVLLNGIPTEVSFDDISWADGGK